MKQTSKTSFVAFFGMLLSALSFFGVLVPQATAAADTCTWTGGGSDDNFTTSANWTGCDNGNVPENGDSLVFDLSTSPDDPSGNETPVNNDLTIGTQFDTITFSGQASETNDGYSIIGNSFEVLDTLDSAYIQANIVVNNQVNVISRGAPGGWRYKVTQLRGDVSGSGGFTAQTTVAGYGAINLSGNNTFTGDLIISSGSLEAYLGGSYNSFGSTVGKTYINDGASLWFTAALGTYTVNEDFVFSGGSATGAYREAKLGIDVGYGPLTGPVQGGMITISGNIDLQNDAVIWSYGHNVTFSDVSDNGHAFTRAAGAFGSFTVEGLSIDSPYYTDTLADSQPATSLNVGNREKITVTGQRGDVVVNYDGFLKGSGSIGALSLLDGGTIAPGLSPGCLASGNLTYSGGTIEIEINGATVCTEYDQQTVMGTVALGTATTLDVSRLTTYAPALNSTYIIISNDSTDAVTGTFAGLAQGASFVDEGVTYQISYTGGDGNDVVLTVTAVPATATTSTPAPAAPNTGIGSIISNPFVPLLAAVLTISTLYGQKLITTKK